MESLPVDWNALGEALAAARAQWPSFPYPWEGLEDALRERGLDALPLVGYGSLISEVSARATIDVGETADRRAVAAFGAKRLFNYRMPGELLERRYGVPRDSREAAALNCETTGDPADALNGILTQVHAKDLDPLRERERHYGLRPALWLPWGDWRAAPRVAYLLECLPENGAPGHPYSADIDPQPEYVRTCREGARAISEAFLRFFDATAFLADRTTPLARSRYVREPGEGPAAP